MGAIIREGRKVQLERAAGQFEPDKIGGVSDVVRSDRPACPWVESRDEEGDRRPAGHESRGERRIRRTGE